MLPPPTSWDPPEGPLYFAKNKNVPPAVSSDPPEMPPYYAKRNLILPLLAGTHLGGRLTCGPTKFTGTEGFVNLVNMNDSRCSDRTMSIQRRSCFFNLWSSCSSRQKQRQSCRVLLPPVAGCDAAQASPPPTTPTAGQDIPLLTHNPCCFAATTASHHSRTSEPSYSSPHGHPLSRLPRLHAIPFLGLTIVHRPGALCAAWSTWSRNNFHRTWTVRGEPDS